MKLNLFLLSFLAFNISFAQDSDIKSWQNSHPEIVFIEQLDYDNLSEEKKSLFNANAIIYTEEIKYTDILAFENQKQLKHPNSLFNYNDPNAQDIKNWLGINKHLTIIRQSKFDSLSSEKQEELIQVQAMVYNGDFLTLNDINSYEESH